MDTLKAFLVSNITPIITGMFGILCCLITAMVSNHIQKTKDKRDQVSALTKQLRAEQERLSSLTSVVELEKNIDKSKGTLYVEELANRQKREICGFCWEKEHLRIPVLAEIYRDPDTGATVQGGKCENCEKFCQYRQGK